MVVFISSCVEFCIFLVILSDLTTLSLACGIRCDFFDLLFCNSVLRVIYTHTGVSF